MSMSIFYFCIKFFLSHYVIKSSYKKKGIEKKTLSKPASSSFIFFKNNVVQWTWIKTKQEMTQ